MEKYLCQEDRYQLLQLSTSLYWNIQFSVLQVSVCIGSRECCYFFSLETLGGRRGNGIDFLIRAETAKVFDVTGCLRTQQCCECDSHGATKSRLSSEKKQRALVFGGAFRAINFPLQTDIPSPGKKGKIQASSVDKAQCVNEPTKRDENNLVFLQFPLLQPLQLVNYLLCQNTARKGLLYYYVVLQKH